MLTSWDGLPAQEDAYIACFALLAAGDPREMGRKNYLKFHMMGDTLI